MAHSIQRLEQRLELQDYKLSALLDVTQGINDRASEQDLLDKFRASLAEHLGIHRLVLYAFDGDWRCLLVNGIEGDVPEGQEMFIELNAELFSIDGTKRFYEKKSKKILQAESLGEEVGETLKIKSNNSYKK